MKIGLLFGTETGNSEMLCEDMEEELGAGFECTIKNMGDVDPADLNADTFYIFVTSTYGNGDLPVSATPFSDKLDAETIDLSSISFAIFGLGDMVFDQTFNHGSEQLMNLLIGCKATMVGTRGMHDASTTEPPEDVAFPWLHTILAELNAQAA